MQITSPEYDFIVFSTRVILLFPHDFSKTFHLNSLNEAERTLLMIVQRDQMTSVLSSTWSASSVVQQGCSSVASYEAKKTILDSLTIDPVSISV